MNDWLIKLAAQQPTNEEQLMDALGDLSVEELQEIAAYDEPQSENLDSFEEKVAQADLMGRELAHLHGDQFEKEALAFLAPLLGAAARWAGGKLLGSAASAVGGKLLGGAANAMKPAAPAAPAVAGAMGGGFKYAGVLNKAVTSVAGAAAKKPAGGGMLGNMVKDHLKGMAVDKATSMLSGGGRAAAPAAQAPVQAMAQAAPAPAFSYGSGKFASVRELYIHSLEKNAGTLDSVVKSVGSSTKGRGFLETAAKHLKENPALATAAAGAALGVGKGLLTDPGVDPMTGQPRSRIGAALKGGLVGGGLGYAGGRFIPGASKKIQGLGEGLSKSLANTDNIQDLSKHVTPPIPDKATKALAAPAAAAPAPHPSTFQAQLGGAAPAALMPGPGESAVLSSPLASGSDPSTNLRTIRGETMPQLPSVMVDPAIRNMSSGSRGSIRGSGGTRLAQPGNSQSGEFMAKGAMSRMSPVERIKLAMMMSKRAAPLFSTNISPAAAGQAVKSGFGGAMGAARQAAKPPPIPTAARQQGGLAGVQRQLNSAQSVAGGGVPGSGGSTVNWNGF